MHSFRKVIFPAFAFCFLAMGFSLSTVAQGERAKRIRPAFIELFTSEGCSSCPPADRLLSEMADDRAHPVIALSEHVDYWDYLGWKDPNSSDNFTERQQNYAHSMRLNSTYTPQIVINGVAETVGNRQAVVKQIVRCQREQNPAILSLKVHPGKNDKELSIELGPVAQMDAPYVANLAFTTDSVTTKVFSGENSGKTLKHRNVVAKLISIFSAPTKESVRLAVPVDLFRSSSQLIVLSLQLRETVALRNIHKIPAEVTLVKQVYGKHYIKETVKDFLKTGISTLDSSMTQNSRNPALKLLELQTKDVIRLSRVIDKSEFAIERILEILVECVQEQGATERLKNFPFPRQYAYFSGVFVWIFLLLLPFGLIDELTKVTSLDWLIVPFSTLISWMFITMEQVGDSSEDPFEMGLNDVPMTAICRNVEIELLNMLGVEDLPEPILPIGDILL